MNSCLKWVGGKAKLAEWLNGFVPAHKCFCEPFGGAMSLLLYRSPSPVEVYNDIDGELVNFWSVLRSDTDKLIGELHSLPYSEELYYRYRDDMCSGTPLERAAKFFYVNRCAFGGSMATSGWGYSAVANAAKIYDNTVNGLADLAIRIRQLMVCNTDFASCIKRFDSPETFFYCDPPYIETEHRYRNSLFKHDDHKRLSDILRGIRGKAMVSYYLCDEAMELYKGWNFATHEDVVNVRNVQLKEEGKKMPCVKRETVLFMNYAYTKTLDFGDLNETTVPVA